MSSQSISRRLVSGGAASALSKLVLAVSALMLNVFLTRLLPPDAVGAYYILTSIVFIGSLIVLLGTQQGIVKLIAQSEDITSDTLVRKAVKSAFFVVFVSLLTFLCLYLIGGWEWLLKEVFETPYLYGVGLLVFVWIGLRSIQVLISQIFRGFHRVGYASIFEGAIASMLLAFALFLVWYLKFDVDFSYVLKLTIISLLISVIFGIAVLLFGPYAQAPKSYGLQLKELLSLSLPLFIATIAVPGFSEAHLWILAIYSSEDQVAIYGAAYRAAKFVVIPLLIINSVIPPMIAQIMSSNDKIKAEKILRATATISGLPSIFIFLMFLIFGDNVMGLLFGDYYASGKLVLLILVFAQTVNSLTGSPGVLLMMSGFQKIVMKYAVISGFLGVVISVILVEKYGYVGVSIGVASGMIFHNIGMSKFCYSKLGMNTLMSFQNVNQVLHIVKKKYCK